MFVFFTLQYFDLDTYCLELCQHTPSHLLFFHTMLKHFDIDFRARPGLYQKRTLFLEQFVLMLVGREGMQQLHPWL